MSMMLQITINIGYVSSWRLHLEQEYTSWVITWHEKTIEVATNLISEYHSCITVDNISHINFEDENSWNYLCQQCMKISNSYIQCQYWFTIDSIQWNNTNNSQWIFSLSSHVFKHITWWCHQMETFSVLLAICAGNSPVPGEFPTQGPVDGAFMFSLICVWINSWVNNH